MSQGQRKKLSTSKLVAMTPLQQPSRVAQQTSPLTGTLNFAAVITTMPPGAPCPLCACFSVFLIITILPYPSLPSAVSPILREVITPEPPPDSSHAFFFKSINTAYKCAKGCLLSGAANVEGSARSTWPFWLDSVTIISDVRLSFSAQTTKTN